jgi:hypothetical protein
MRTALFTGEAWNMSYNIQYSHYHMSSVIIDINYIISKAKNFARARPLCRAAFEMCRVLQTLFRR